MMINQISTSNNVYALNSELKTKKREQNQLVSNPIEKIIPNTNNDHGAFKSYFLGSQATFGGKTGKKNNDPIKQYVNSLPFADELSPADKRALGNVLRKKDEETDYMKKMIHLVCKNMVTPMATASLCQKGKMSDLAKNDIDIYYDKVKGQKMSIKDAFIPQHGSQTEGQKASQIGDVFRVDGQDMIYVKTDEEASMQLKMDADTYLKLYPPVERFSSAQGGTGDCYLLSTINSIMENPKARPVLYNCFTQHGNSVSAEMPNGVAKVLFPDCKLPEGADRDKYTDGPMGMKMLEHLYGVEIEEKKFLEYDMVMQDEFAKLDKQLAKWEKKIPQDNLALKKQKEIKTKIANYQKGQEQVNNAKNDPNHKLTFELDDDDNFIMGKFGPMFQDCDKIDEDYKFPSDYYRGGLGGYMHIAAGAFGFDAENLEVGLDDEYIDDILLNSDPEDYIIAAGTHPEEEGEMESPQEVAYSIYSSHAYKVAPFDDEKGNRMFKITNPWNQSHQITMNLEQLKEYFSDFSFAKVV